MYELYTILLRIILPIFVLVGVGIFLERRFRLDIATMSKLNFYIFVPAFLFKALMESEIDFRKLAVVALFQAALIAALMVVNAGVRRGLGLTGALGSAFMLATVFCNSGNFGIPLVSLAFPENVSLAASYQAIAVMVQNLSTFTLGLIIVGHGSGGMWKSFAATLKLPFIYIVIAALALRWLGVGAADMEKIPFIWNPVVYAGNGLIAVALVTLGVQIAKTPRVRHSRTLAVATGMRLLAAPVVAFLIMKLFGFEGMLAKLVVIASAGPSAVNTVLIGLEFDNEPEFAASAVFYSTLFCGLTVALTIFLVRHFMA